MKRPLKVTVSLSTKTAAHVKVTAQNNFELFCASVTMNKTFKIEGMLDSGSMDCSWAVASVKKQRQGCWRKK